MTLPFPPEHAGSGTNRHHLKTLIRKRLLALRATINKPESDQLLAKKIQALPEYQNAHKIGFYSAIKSELSVAKILAQALKDNKQCFLPKTNADTLEYIEYTKNSTLVADQYGILTPLGKNNQPQLDLIIIPCVGLHKNGHRIGYGKGHFDRYLEKNQALKLGVAFCEQEFTEDIKEPFDILCDFTIFI